LTIVTPYWCLWGELVYAADAAGRLGLAASNVVDGFLRAGMSCHATA
jgi:hypothetical protein